jgi:hypothetical protein
MYSKFPPAEAGWISTTLFVLDIVTPVLLSPEYSQPGSGSHRSAGLKE